VNNVVNALPPNVSAVVAVASGLYDHQSCGAETTLPLTLLGAGSEATVVDCAGTDRMVLTYGPYFVTCRP
jgi:hypothetical protein